MRIQKYLSLKNILSRRKAEEYLQKGWIKVNGEVVTELGTKIDPDRDIITLVDEARVHQKNTVTIVFYKPVGIVSNCPEPGQQQITDLLPKQFAELHTIGRLDKDSEGLILLTDDGVLAKNLLSHEHVREYSVRVDKPVTQDMIERLESGVMVDGRWTLPTTITMLTPLTFIIRLNEGRNRQIRRMAEDVGLCVLHLKRFRFGPIVLGDLNKGECRLLTPQERQDLFFSTQEKGLRPDPPKNRSSRRFEN